MKKDNKPKSVQCELTLKKLPDVVSHVRRTVLPHHGPIDAHALNHCNLVQSHNDVFAYKFKDKNDIINNGIS